MANSNREYCSFLLSMKKVQTNDLQTWIVALRNVHTGQQQIFSNLNGLIEFLQTEFDDPREQKEAGQSGTQAVRNYPIEQPYQNT